MKKFQVHGYRTDDKSVVSIRWCPADEEPGPHNAMIGIDIRERLPIESVMRIEQAVTNELNKKYKDQFASKQIIVPAAGQILIVKPNHIAG
jgi:hypothetical protein